MVFHNKIDDIYNAIDNGNSCYLIELCSKVKVVFNHLIKRDSRISKILKENDILLIIDEVQTGVYRTGEFSIKSL